MGLFFKVTTKRSIARRGIGSRERPVGEVTTGESTSLPVPVDADAGPRAAEFCPTSIGSGAMIALKTRGPTE